MNKIELGDIKNNIHIDNIKECFIYHFKNINYDKKAPAHYHIVIPTKGNSYICLVLFTSQVEKKKTLYNYTNKIALNCLIDIEEDSFSFIKQDSLIDCNEVLYKSKEELKLLVEGDINKIDCEVDSELIEEIKEKIKKSPLVKPFIKDDL